MILEKDGYKNTGDNVSETLNIGEQLFNKLRSELGIKTRMEEDNDSLCLYESWYVSDESKYISIWSSDYNFESYLFSFKIETIIFYVITSYTYTYLTVVETSSIIPHIVIEDIIVSNKTCINDIVDDILDVIINFEEFFKNYDINKLLIDKKIRYKHSDEISLKALPTISNILLPYIRYGKINKIKQLI